MYPKRKDLFTAWSKAMVEGSTVDKPNYGKSSQVKRAPRASRARRKRAQRHRRKKNAQA